MARGLWVDADDYEIERVDLDDLGYSPRAEEELKKAGGGQDESGAGQGCSPLTVHRLVQL